MAAASYHTWPAPDPGKKVNFLQELGVPKGNWTPRVLIFHANPSPFRVCNEAMPRRHFTVVEVNRLIPSLERIFVDVSQLHAGLRRSEAHLETLGCAASRAVLNGKDVGGSPGVRRGKALVRGYYEALIESMGRVADLGGSVRDLDNGVVDFPGRRGSEDIFLSWQLGEKRVRHWHPVDTGVAARRPIDHLVPHEPSPLE